MLDPSLNRGLSLHDAARAMGIEFSHDALPQDKYFESDGMRFHYLDWRLEESYNYNVAWFCPAITFVGFCRVGFV